MSSQPRSALDVVLGYHEATKHHPNRYARSSGYLDWAIQPNPFRNYAGARVTTLPFAAPEPDPEYAALYGLLDVTPAPVSLASLAALFRYSLGLSAWKSYGGERWALRCNPSSGNLHPTEGYLIVGPVEGLSDEPAVFHYAPNRHAFERRAVIPTATWDRLLEPCPRGAFLVGLTSIAWREAWKYGERAYRYCQHDVGHALAALRISAAVLGWRLALLSTADDDAVARALTLAPFAASYAPRGHAPEPEWPELLAAVSPDADAGPLRIAAAALSDAPWVRPEGKANRLSAEHVHWPLIDLVAQACRKPRTAARAPAGHGRGGSGGTVLASPSPFTARRLILRRRSAQAMDGKSCLPRERFYEMLARTLPTHARSPWDALDDVPRVHLVLFVHRVRGLEPGIYLLARARHAREALRSVLRPSYAWATPEGTPDSLDIRLLERGDVRRFTAEASCGQDIASEGVFAVAMIAEFEPVLRREGPWAYRRLYWETGMVGQVLYLEAEAAGMRGTGIGCYFDDMVHHRLGIADRSYQSLYHFTVGGPLEDRRLITLPPYANEG